MSDRRIYIEINNTCNLKCTFCPYAYKKDVVPSNMPFEILKDTLVDIKENIDYRIIYFHNLNEPLLYPKFKELLEFCKEQEIKYGITTNGLQLDKYSTEISKSNMQELNISYQVINEQMNHERGNYMTVEEYRNYILKYTSNIEKNFSGDIKIKLLITNNKSYFNGKQILGIENHEQLIQELEHFYFYFYNTALGEQNEKLLRSIPLDKFCKIKITSKIYVELFPFLTWGNVYGKIHKAYVGKCDGFSGQLQIKCNGDVLPCCYDVEADLIVGNIFEDRLSIIREKERYKKAEKRVMSKWIYYERCRVCQGKSNMIELWKQQCNTFFKDQIEDRFTYSNNTIELQGKNYL